MMRNQLCYERSHSMRFCLFYHSLVSDWNHGNAHFLRGVASELMARGHDVRVFEPGQGWSRANLERDHGRGAIEAFAQVFPELASHTYDATHLDLAEALEEADVVIAHEWTDAAVLRQLAEGRARGGKYCLLFHDTHHRAVSDPDALHTLPLERFDGVLAFGRSLADEYERLGWNRRVWVWHEAADTRRFFPRPAPQLEGDLVWIGNWGDGERVEELTEFLLEPVRALRLHARVHGVRYPESALTRLRESGIAYGGWLPNHRVPQVFGAFRVTVHVPRRPYAAQLPGIPTIRPFEAMACGIPLISAPWDDVEGLFRSGDYIRVDSGSEMTDALRTLLADEAFAADLATRGRETILARHTCAHRVDELLGVIASLRAPSRAALAPQEA